MNSLNCKRDTTCKWKKKKNWGALHIDYTAFLGCLESFYDKPGKQNQEKKLNRVKKKKKWTI